MPHSTKPVRGPQFYSERELDRRTAPGPRGKKAREQAERSNYPSQHEFGESEYIDEHGREYRVAYLNKMGGWPPHTVVPPRSLIDPQHLKAATSGNRKCCWIKIRRGHHEDWPITTPTRTILLRPVRAGLTTQLVRVVGAFRDNPRGRTGLVEVIGLEE